MAVTPRGEPDVDRLPARSRQPAAGQVRTLLQARERKLRAEVEATRTRGASDPLRVARESTDRGEGSRAEVVENGINDAEVARDVAELCARSAALARLEAATTASAAIATS